jgi:hypothetical protein
LTPLPVEGVKEELNHQLTPLFVWTAESFSFIEVFHILFNEWNRRIGRIAVVGMAVEVGVSEITANFNETGGTKLNTPHPSIPYHLRINGSAAGLGRGRVNTVGDCILNLVEEQIPLPSENGLPLSCMVGDVVLGAIRPWERLCHDIGVHRVYIHIAKGLIDDMPKNLGQPSRVMCSLDLGDRRRLVVGNSDVAEEVPSEECHCELGAGVDIKQSSPRKNLRLLSTCNRLGEVEVHVTKTVGIEVPPFSELKGCHAVSITVLDDLSLVLLPFRKHLNISNIEFSLLVELADLIGVAEEGA